MDFLGQQVLWGVHWWQLGLALLLIFLGFLSKKVIRSLFGGYFKSRASSTDVQWDDDVVELAAAPLAAVAQILLWYASASLINLPVEPTNVRLIVFQGLEVAIAIAVIWLFFRLLDVAALALNRHSDTTDSKLDDQLVPLLRKTLKVFVTVVVGVMVIQNLGYSVTSIIASLGIGGLALALAAKDAVANFFGSIIVFTDQPFHVGDWIEIDGLEGTVEEVGFRTTLVRTFDRSLATIPNQTFTSNTIINHSRRPMRRIKMTIGLSYESTPDELVNFKNAVRQIIESNSAFDEGYHVYFDNFGDSSLDVLVYCFVKTSAYAEYMAAKEDLMLQIMRIVEQHGLEIAFPSRTVYLREENVEG